MPGAVWKHPELLRVQFSARSKSFTVIFDAKLLHLADRGTGAVGNCADLLVMHADPLVDIRNTRKIPAVYHDGRSIRELRGR